MRTRSAEDHFGDESTDRWCADPSTLLGGVGCAVIANDTRGAVCYWNRDAERIYGWASAEAIGANVLELMVPSSGRATAASIMRIVGEGQRWSGSFPLRRRDGSTLLAMVTESGIHDVAGELVGVVGVSMPLGEALVPLLDRSPNARVTLDYQGRLDLISQACTGLLGWSEEASRGRTMWDLLHPEDRAAVVEGHRRVVSGLGGSPLECRLRSSGGTWMWVEIVFTDLGDLRPVGAVVCDIRDISARQRDHRALVELAEQLQTALDSRVVIEQAKGMVAQLHGIATDQAFEMIRRHARSHGARIHDVADAIVNLRLRI